MQAAAEAIDAAGALLITTGQVWGRSLTSGGLRGFGWPTLPSRKLGLSFEELANPAWFKDDPALAWAFLRLVTKNL
jgi:hypothetical protein